MCNEALSKRRESKERMGEGIDVEEMSNKWKKRRTKADLEILFSDQTESFSSEPWLQRLHSVFNFLVSSLLNL